jgi:hypothetical protein
MAVRDGGSKEQGREDEGLLSRWSRRKAEARRTAAQDASEREQAPERPPAPAPEPAEPGRIDPRDLPDIESLTAESDFTVFMKKGVPPELRQQALRKLWRSNPVLANLDGLLEYGEDYTHIGRGGMSVRTAYQVGRGFVRKLEEIAGGEPAEPAKASPEAPEAVPLVEGCPGAETEPPPAAEAAREGPITPSKEPPPAGHVQASSRRRRRLPKRG